MAIYNGRILMRKGNEADFDAEKLMSGEWAVSLDKGIVRICLEAGKVIRMATYEAFEEDMKRVEEILLECQTVKEAVARINTEVSTKANAVVELVEQAKTYRDEAEQFRNEAESFKNQAGEIVGIDIATTERAGISKPDGETLEIDPDGTLRVIGGGGVSDYEEIENKPSINSVELSGNKTLEELGIASKEELDKTVFKVDTIIEKADLGIKETAIGEEIHLTDSADGKAVEFALYGKAKQNTTSGKNLLDTSTMAMERNGITYTVNEDGSVTANGTATGLAQSTVVSIPLKAGNYILSGGKLRKRRIFALVNGTYYDDIGNGIAFTVTEDMTITSAITIESGEICSNEIFYPMIRLASITDDTYEPYTNGASPNPDYPQEIEVSGASYNLLENTATSKEINGVVFTVNNDKSITVSGTASEQTLLNIDTYLSEGDYILSGDIDGSLTTHSITYAINDSWSARHDIGSGIDFSLNDTSKVTVALMIRSGYKADNITFYPMIRKVSVKNDRYMPFGVDSVEVKSATSNLLDYSKANGYQSGNFEVVNNNNGSYSVVGTATATMLIKCLPVKLKANVRYWLSGAIQDKIQLSLRNENSSNIYLDCKKESVSITPTEDVILYFYIRVGNGISVNEVVYPMLNYGEVALPYEPYKESKAIINGEYAGIKVSDGGNYTDSNGQQWICDSVVKYADGSGKHIQKLKYLNVKSFLGSHGNKDKNSILGYVALDGALTENDVVGNVMCNIANAVSGNYQWINNISSICINDAGKVVLNISNIASIDELTTYVNEHDVYVLYELAEPITTPLTAEELAEIEKLHTFYPITNISNDAECGMSVTYKCDGKNYIDKRLALIEQALINNI